MGRKEQIYRLLSQTEEICSGDRIGAALGISRVSVWKHIQAMIDAGIPVVSSARGYRLAADGDNLQSLTLGPLAGRVHYFKELSSTMDEAAALARDGCPHGTIVVAEHQQRGRGRLGRLWDSGRGGLWFTVIVRPELALPQAGLTNLAAAVELREVLKRRYGLECLVKWPNDLLFENRKLCGILSQMESEGGLVRYIAIGIGLNVNNRPGAEQPGAVSLAQLFERKIPRGEILEDFVERYLQRLDEFDPNRLLHDWRQINSTLGRKVSIATLGETIRGTAVELDHDGGLVLELADGSRRTVVHGDCFYDNR